MQEKIKQQIPSESIQQICLFRWALMSQAKYPVLKLLYHIPNEGKRSASCGSRLKKEGLKPGVPDVCLPVARGIYHGLYIEMKAGNNKPSADQEDWLKDLKSEGYYTGVCYSWDKAAEIIASYLEQRTVKIL